MQEKKLLMPKQARNFLAGLTGAGVFGITLVSTWGLGFLLAGGIALGAGAAANGLIRLFVPARPGNDEMEVAPGVSRVRYREFINTCKKSLLQMDQAVKATPFGKSSEEWKSLVAVMVKVVRNCEDDPQDVLKFPLMPEYYSRLAAMYEEYARMQKYRDQPQVEEKSLMLENKVPGLITEFQSKLEAMQQDNLMSLEVSSNTLDALLRSE